MDLTPEMQQISQPSNCLSDSFDSMLESTPKLRVSFSSNDKRKFNDSSCYIIEEDGPQLSSTLNESVINKLSDCNLNNKELIYNTTTPRKKQKLNDNNNYYKQFTSPIQETRDILYENNIRFRQTKKYSTPIKKQFYLLNSTSSTLKIEDVIKNDVIMNIIFTYLSDNDLYRFSLVSELTKLSILNNPKAKRRYLKSKEFYNINKENYKITPPNSPLSSSSSSDSNKSSPTTSPKRWNNNENSFRNFVKATESLKPNQRLTKCPKCQCPSVVDNNIAQCKNYQCRYIICLTCLSCSISGPENFYDSCKNSKLLLIQNNNNSNRRNLNDISNLTINNDLSFTSLLSSTITSSATITTTTTQNDSGFHSDYENSFKIRKNLMKSFNGGANTLKVNNQNSCSNNNSLRKLNEIKKIIKKQRNSDIIPVVPLTNNSMNQVLVESPPPSPPKIQNYSIGSKQSKRNVKRATR